MGEYCATVDEHVYLLLSAVAKNAAKLGIPWLVVGATARELLLEKVYGLPTGRATVDIDFGVMVEKWERYEALVRAICNDVRFYRDSKQTQRPGCHAAC